MRSVGSAELLADIVLPFALVLYLALMGGGYDSIVYSQVGIAGLVAADLGLDRRNAPLDHHPARGMAGRRAVRGIHGLDRARDLLVRKLGAQRRRGGPGGVLRGRLRPCRCRHRVATRCAGRSPRSGAAIAVVAVLALLQRFQPNWFPASETFEFIPSARARLSYPLGYWNALAGLLAIGMPLLVWVAVSARSVIARALATAALPALALAAFFTLSRGGAFAVLAGLATLLRPAPAAPGAAAHPGDRVRCPAGR